MRLKAVGSRLGSMPSRLGFAQGDERQANRERSVMEPWRKWYGLAEWKALRIETFRRDGFKCRMCLRIDGNTSRLVCDHIKPHKGDRELFFDPVNLQTLCKPCHDGAKQRIERGSGRLKYQPRTREGEGQSL